MQQRCIGWIAATLLLISFSATGQTRTVVVPLAGVAGNATAGDVVKGKTFSSRSAGKGVTGTLDLPPTAVSYTNTIGMTFHLLPAGSFTMGSPVTESGRASSFETRHQVTLTRPFFMQTTEVTNKQWNTLLVATGLGVNPSLSNPGDVYPVDNVNWYEAAYFSNQLSVKEKLPSCYTLGSCNTKKPGEGMECSSVAVAANCKGYRLPTEAEWEYAARAGTVTPYGNPVHYDATSTETGVNFNPNLDAMGWYGWNDSLAGGYPSGSKPVAQKQPNRWGLYDMHGNVWEWCQDWWDGTTDYAPGPVTDPTGQTTGSTRVIRSSGWDNSAARARSADRDNGWQGYRWNTQGFRLVLPSSQ